MSVTYRNKAIRGTYFYRNMTYNKLISLSSILSLISSLFCILFCKKNDRAAVTACHFNTFFIAFFFENRRCGSHLFPWWQTTYCVFLINLKLRELKGAPLYFKKYIWEFVVSINHRKAILLTLWYINEIYMISFFKSYCCPSGKKIKYILETVYMILLTIYYFY